MKIKIDKKIFEIFPELKVGIIISKNIDNNYNFNESEFKNLLLKSFELSQRYIQNDDFKENIVIKKWREAFYKFKTKKGARSSIESILKRVNNGKNIGNISPIVDIYNSISLEYAIPVGSEDLDKIINCMELTFAKGGENFKLIGSDKNEPALENEIVYKDDDGIICRSFNWRESERTMIRDSTKNAIFVLEIIDKKDEDNLNNALNELKTRINKYLNSEGEIYILDKENLDILI